ncbi:hypothetical protein A2U01_0089307, partial [Trifolium medium]|nr:hypothetical protein [Trifolium medium]
VGGECSDISNVCSGDVRTRGTVGRPVREEVCRIDCFAVKNVSAVE